jgi:hypothetical protein
MIRRGAPFTASIFAILVLAVFWVLQDYGPESTVRRFNQDIRDGHLDDTAGLTLEGPMTYDAEGLRSYTGMLLRYGGTYRIISMQRSPHKVVAIALYSFPNGDQRPFYWVVYNLQNRWQISAGESLRYTQVQLGLQ